MTSAKQEVGKSGERKVFTIKNADLLRLLDLQPSRDSKYSYQELFDQGEKSMDELFQRARVVVQMEPGKRSEFDRRTVMELASHIRLAIELGPLAMRYKSFPYRR